MLPLTSSFPHGDVRLTPTFADFTVSHQMTLVNRDAPDAWLGRTPP